MPRLVNTQVSISNMALRHLAQTAGIVDFDNDASEAAEACRVFYDQVLEEVLRDFPWTFATVITPLTLVDGPSPPASTAYACSYRYPVDCLKLRRIINPNAPRIELQSTRIPYRVTRDDAGLVILTDFEPVAATATTPAQPEVEYTSVVDDTGLYPADFAQTCALLLATYIAPSLTAGDRFKLGEKAMAKYEWARLRAQNNAINEQQPDQPPDAEWIQARE